MRNKSIEIPDSWSIIKISNNPNDIYGKEPYYKVFASWRGGYLDGDRYKFNSGITKVEEDKDNFYFYGYSGSCYKCHKQLYDRHSSWALGILETTIENSAEYGIIVEKLPEDTNWLNLIK